MKQIEEGDISSSFSAYVQVIEGRGFAPKDPSKLSDPYCLIGVPSASLGSFLDLDKCMRYEVLPPFLPYPLPLPLPSHREMEDKGTCTNTQVSISPQCEYTC